MSYILCSTEQNDTGVDSIKIEEYSAVLGNGVSLDSVVGTYCGESTEKVQFFKDQNEKCLRFITFLSTNRLNKAMIGRKRRVKRLFLRY